VNVVSMIDRRDNIKEGVNHKS